MSSLSRTNLLQNHCRCENIKNSFFPTHILITRSRPEHKHRRLIIIISHLDGSISTWLGTFVSFNASLSLLADDFHSLLRCELMAIKRTIVMLLVLRLWRIFHGSPSGERSQLLDAKEFKSLSLPTPQLAHKFLHSYSDFITVSPHYPFRFGFFTIWSFMNGGDQSQLKVAKFCFASFSLFFIWLKLPEATCAKYELITIQNASNPLSVTSIRKSKIYLHF